MLHGSMLLFVGRGTEIDVVVTVGSKLVLDIGDQRRAEEDRQHPRDRHGCQYALQNWKNSVSLSGFPLLFALEETDDYVSQYEHGVRHEHDEVEPRADSIWVCSPSLAQESAVVRN